MRHDYLGTAKLKRELERFFGPTVRLQRIDAAGVPGARVLVGTGGATRVWAQTFTANAWGVETQAAIEAIRHWHLRTQARDTLNTIGRMEAGL